MNTVQTLTMNVKYQLLGSTPTKLIEAWHFYLKKKKKKQYLPFTEKLMDVYVCEFIYTAATLVITFTAF